LNCPSCEEKIEKVIFANHYETCQKRPFYCSLAKIYFPYEIKEIYEIYFKDITSFYTNKIQYLLIKNWSKYNKTIKEYCIKYDIIRNKIRNKMIDDFIYVYYFFKLYWIIALS